MPVLIFGEAFTALQVIVIISGAERFQGQFPNNLPSLDRNVWKRRGWKWLAPVYFPAWCSTYFLSRSLCVPPLALSACLWSLESLALSTANTTPDLGPGQYQEWPPGLLHLIMIVNIDGKEIQGRRRKDSTLREGSGSKMSSVVPFLFAPVLACIGVFPQNYTQQCQVFFCNDSAFCVKFKHKMEPSPSSWKRETYVNVRTSRNTFCRNQPWRLLEQQQDKALLTSLIFHSLKHPERTFGKTKCSTSVDRTRGSLRGLVATDFVWFHL